MDEEAICSSLFIHVVIVILMLYAAGPSTALGARTVSPVL
jgi:hypothetical protein